MAVKVHRSLKAKARFYWSINWIKTLYFNYKKFPFSIACKLPVYFYGRVKFQDISGQIIIDAPIKRGMIGFGQLYEKYTVHKGIAEIALVGKIVFKGHMQFGKDYFVSVDKDAYAEFGHMCGIASDGKFICTKSIIFGNYVRVASEARIVDTDFHYMVSTITGEKSLLSAPVRIGNYNYMSNRVSVLKGTTTPDYCTIASNSLCNKDYSAFGENILIGGVPAILLRKNITRDWKTEEKLFDEWMEV